MFLIELEIRATWISQQLSKKNVQGRRRLTAELNSVHKNIDKIETRFPQQRKRK